VIRFLLIIFSVKKVNTARRQNLQQRVSHAYLTDFVFYSKTVSRSRMVFSTAACVNTVY